MYSEMNTVLAGKRACERFITKDRALVLISPNPNPVHVMNISKNGLAFKYLGKELMTIQTEKLKLYYENKSYLDGIPFEIVFDELFELNNYISLRRCGIKFGKLTSTQQAFIADFITNYTQ